MVDKKPGIGLLIGVGPKLKGKGPPMADDAPDEDDGMKDKMGISAMRELAAHLKSGDAASAWDCFKQAQSLADDDDDKPEGGDEEGPDAA